MSFPPCRRPTSEKIGTLTGCSVQSPVEKRLSQIEDPTSEPPHSALVAAHIVYGLHAFAITLGILGSTTVIGGFVGSVPSIIAVIISYVKRGGARGTWAASHFRWQIRTFWFALLWLVVAVLLIVTLIGAPVGLSVLLFVTVWLIYRIARGWLRLVDRRPMYTGGMPEERVAE
jgi:uncharacterized membrane protein